MINPSQPPHDSSQPDVEAQQSTFMNPQVVGGAGRRIPVWVWIVGSLATAAVLLVAGLMVAGVIRFGVASNTVHDDQQRDKAFTAADPAGSKACDWLDMHLHGIATWQQAKDAAAESTTVGVRDATSPRQMYDACAAAGANMSEWREPQTP